MSNSFGRRGSGSAGERPLRIKYIRIISNTISDKGYPLLTTAGEGAKQEDEDLNGVYELNESYVEPSQDEKVVITPAVAAELCHAGKAIACDKKGNQVSIYGDDMPPKERYPKPKRKTAKKK